MNGNAELFFKFEINLPFLLKKQFRISPMGKFIFLKMILKFLKLPKKVGKILNVLRQIGKLKINFIQIVRNYEMSLIK